jgi:hypothetical protein
MQAMLDNFFLVPDRFAFFTLFELQADEATRVAAD